MRKDLSLDSSAFKRFSQLPREKPADGEANLQKTPKITPAKASATRGRQRWSARWDMPPHFAAA